MCASRGSDPIVSSSCLLYAGSFAEHTVRVGEGRQQCDELWAQFAFFKIFFCALLFCHAKGKAGITVSSCQKPELCVAAKTVRFHAGSLRNLLFNICHDIFVYGCKNICLAESKAESFIMLLCDFRNELVRDAYFICHDFKSRCFV